MSDATRSRASIRSLVIELAGTEDELRALRLSPATAECRARRRRIVRRQASLIRQLHRLRGGAAGELIGR